MGFSLRTICIPPSSQRWSSCVFGHKRCAMFWYVCKNNFPIFIYYFFSSNKILILSFWDLKICWKKFRFFFCFKFVDSIFSFGNKNLFFYNLLSVCKRKFIKFGGETIFCSKFVRFFFCICFRWFWEDKNYWVLKSPRLKKITQKKLWTPKNIGLRKLKFFTFISFKMDKNIRMCLGSRKKRLPRKMLIFNFTQKCYWFRKKVFASKWITSLGSRKKCFAKNKNSTSSKKIISKNNFEIISIV